MTGTAFAIPAMFFIREQRMVFFIVMIACKEHNTENYVESLIQSDEDYFNLQDMAKCDNRLD